MRKITILLCTMFIASTFSAKNIYVATDGSNSNDGSSWSSAVKDLKNAYEKASAGDIIWMAGGVYAFTETINMKDEVNVYGGFAKGDASIGARIQPNAAGEPWKFTNETVLTIEMPTSIRPFDRVDKTTSWKGAILDGLVFRDIETSDGRVAYLSDGVTLQNSIVLNCACSNTIMYFERNGIIRNCLFEGNYAQSKEKSTVALQLRGSKENEPGNLVENTVFRGNKSESLSIYNTNPAGDKPGKHSVKNVSFIGNKNSCVLLNEQSERPIEISYCLFEGNESASAAATNASGTLITGGVAGICDIANCIIRNNKNTIAADADWKNALIYLDSKARMMNCLIENNSCLKLSIYAKGSIYNSTIVNNEGSIFGALMATLMNNAILGNQPTEGKKVIDMDSSSACYLVNNAIGSSSDIAEGSTGVDIMGTVYTDMSVFVNPTTFVGVASNETQKTEIANADFSLVTGSACVNAGDAEQVKEFLADGNVLTTLFAKDLAGNDRFTGSMISIGAYQGPATTGVKVTIKDETIRVYAQAKNLVVETDGNASAHIYNIAGVLITSQHLVAGENRIPLNDEGIYLVKVNGRTFKCFVK